MSAPFATVRHGDGFVHIDAAADWAFRKALIDGCPEQIRPKMREALAVIPGKRAAAHSKRYFGKELPAILERCNALIDVLDKFNSERLNLPGFEEWLRTTGFCNDYRMIKALNTWATM
jgi:hypothetical protein